MSLTGANGSFLLLFWLCPKSTKWAANYNEAFTRNKKTSTETKKRPTNIRGAGRECKKGPRSVSRCVCRSWATGRISTLWHVSLHLHLTAWGDRVRDVDCYQRLAGSNPFWRCINGFVCLRSAYPGLHQIKYPDSIYRQYMCGLVRVKFLLIVIMYYYVYPYTCALPKHSKRLLTEMLKITCLNISFLDCLMACSVKEPHWWARKSIMALDQIQTMPVPTVAHSSIGQCTIANCRLCLPGDERVNLGRLLCSLLSKNHIFKTEF